MRLELGCVDQDVLFLAALGGQTLHHPGKDTHVTPSLPSIVERLGRPILPRSVASPQAIAINEDYPAQYPPMVDSRLAMAVSEEGPQPLHLLVRQPEKMAHHHPRKIGSLNHAASGAPSRSMGSDPGRQERLEI